MKKYVYMFKEGDAGMRNLLGGKGANLAEMSRLGLPVPQGFTITTEACNEYYTAGAELTTEMIEQIFVAMTKMEEITGKKFGDLENPLLVSVRSGARASMPGMMDTILNLGLNREVVKVLAEKTNNPRFAYDSYRRFIMMFSDVVMEIEKSNFEAKMDELKERLGVDSDADLDADAMAELSDTYLQVYERLKATVPGKSSGTAFCLSPPYSVLGTIIAPSITGACTIYRAAGVLLSMCRRWYMAIWGIPRARV